MKYNLTKKGLDCMGVRMQKSGTIKVKSAVGLMKQVRVYHSLGSARPETLTLKPWPQQCIRLLGVECYLHMRGQVPVRTNHKAVASVLSSYRSHLN